MKKITLNLLKGLLVIVLFTGEASAKISGLPQGSAEQSVQRLTANKVSQYFTNKGYDVYNVTPVGRSGKWRAIVADETGTIKTLIIDSGTINAGTSNSVLVGQESSC